MKLTAVLLLLAASLHLSVSHRIGSKASVTDWRVMTNNL